MPPEARRLWRKLAKKLLAAGLLSDMDGTTLERYCRAYVVWRGLIVAVETQLLGHSKAAYREAARLGSEAFSCVTQGETPSPSGSIHRSPVRGSSTDPEANGAEARRWEREVLIPLGAALGLNYAARSRMRAPQNQTPDDTELEVFGLKAIQGGR